MIQLTAEDMEPKLGGKGGYELGQRCISEFRIWLFRTPLMRELEQQGEMTSFRLEPQEVGYSISLTLVLVGTKRFKTDNINLATCLVAYG